MKKLGSILLVIALLVTSVSLVGCGGSKEPAGQGGGDAVKAVTFKLGHVGVADPEHPWEKYALKYAAEVEKATEGRVKIQTYPASQLGADREMAEAIQSGTLEMGAISTIAMGNFVPKLMVWDLPYIWPTDNAKVDKILEGSDISNLLIEEAAKKKLNILGFFENDWRGFTSNKKQITKPADAVGQKTRIVENKPSTHFFKAIGTIPTPMAVSELYTALQQGTVDAQDNGAVFTHGNKFYEVQDYFTNTKHMYCPLAIVISDKAKASISAEDYEILKNVAVEVAREQRAYSRQMNKEYMEKFKAQGVKVLEELSPEGLKEFQDVAAETYKIMEADLGKDLIDMMLAHRD